MHHPNVVTVYGADLRDARAGMWMELVAGETLEEVLAAHGPFEPREAMRVVRDLASALHGVHRAGLVHGDVKSSNVMLERLAEPAPGDAAGTPTPRRVVLMDFGAASASGPVDGAARFATPIYAPPEVLAGGPATPSADIRQRFGDGFNEPIRPTRSDPSQDDGSDLDSCARIKI